ncbi:hypothetical protein WHR41_01872 [Cladosporium halotolerans]|uniref:Uncharacterized protein n=1 Tax=Cladosporium halotolerans TaxID=1052096 RepID=A0AB34L1M2_9PEZI
MPQAQLKKSKTGPKTPAKPSQRVQTGNRVIKPKKASLVKAHHVHKKHTAGLSALTEKALAGKAGHLELLRGGKKDRKLSEPGKPTGGKAANQKKG